MGKKLLFQIIAIIISMLVLSMPISAAATECYTYDGARQAARTALFSDKQILTVADQELLEQTLLQTYRDAIKERYPEIAPSLIDPFCDNFLVSQDLAAAFDNLKKLELGSSGTPVTRETFIPLVQQSMEDSLSAAESAPSYFTYKDSDGNLRVGGAFETVKGDRITYVARDSPDELHRIIYMHEFLHNLLHELGFNLKGVSEETLINALLKRLGIIDAAAVTSLTAEGISIGAAELTAAEQTALASFDAKLQSSKMRFSNRQRYQDLKDILLGAKRFNNPDDPYYNDFKLYEQATSIYGADKISPRVEFFDFYATDADGNVKKDKDGKPVETRLFKTLQEGGLSLDELAKKTDPNIIPKKEIDLLIRDLADENLRQDTIVFLLAIAAQRPEIVIKQLVAHLSDKDASIRTYTAFTLKQIYGSPSNMESLAITSGQREATKDQKKNAKVVADALLKYVPDLIKALEDQSAVLGKKPKKGQEDKQHQAANDANALLSNLIISLDSVSESNPELLVKTLPTLVKLMENEDFREYIQTTLLNIAKEEPDKVASALVDGLKSDNEAVREACAETLDEMLTNDPAPVLQKRDDLIKLLKNDAARDNALWLLYRISQVSPETLLKSVKDMNSNLGDSPLNQEAIEMLINIGMVDKKRIVPAADKLISALDDKSLRPFAAIALTYIMSVDKKAVPATEQERINLIYITESPSIEGEFALAHQQAENLKAEKEKASNPGFFGRIFGLFRRSGTQPAAQTAVAESAASLQQKDSSQTSAAQSGSTTVKRDPLIGQMTDEMPTAPLRSALATDTPVDDSPIVFAGKSYKTVEELQADHPEYSEERLLEYVTLFRIVKGLLSKSKTQLTEAQLEEYSDLLARDIASMLTTGELALNYFKLRYIRSLLPDPSVEQFLRLKFDYSDEKAGKSNKALWLLILLLLLLTLSTDKNIAKLPADAVPQAMKTEIKKAIVINPEILLPAQLAKLKNIIGSGKIPSSTIGVTVNQPVLPAKPGQISSVDQTSNQKSSESGKTVTQNTNTGNETLVFTKQKQESGSAHTNNTNVTI